jgi:hypothetical protein
MPLRSSAAAFLFQARSTHARSRDLSIGLDLSDLAQCEDPSSLLLVAKRIDARKTTMMTGTTTNGEVMLIGQLLTSRLPD